MEQQDRNLYMSLRKPQPGRSAENNRIKLGNIWSKISFQVQLKAAEQWDRWVMELENNLKMIVGAQGISLSYLIRENDALDQIERDTW